MGLYLWEKMKKPGNNKKTPRTIRNPFIEVQIYLGRGEPYDGQPADTNSQGRNYP